MKKAFGPKLKIFLVIFLSSLLLTNFGNSQTGICTVEGAVSSGWLESPKFCFGKKVNITKFVWKGTAEGGCIDFTLEGFETSTTNVPTARLNFSVPPGSIYKNPYPEEANYPYLLKQIQCVRYRTNLYKYEENATPRIDQIFIYYSF